MITPGIASPMLSRTSDADAELALDELTGIIRQVARL
jgi:hypothetical protein